ncbi:MAG: LVIVD repeat-containing protein, partial [Acidimicrobiales bacterium]
VSAATHTGAALRLVGRSDLGGAGLNGDVATLGTTVIVAAGVVVDTGDHTERYNPIPCFPAMTVKIVNAADPANPKVAATIPLPTGVAAIDVDALRVATPSFTGDLLAVALDDGPSHQGPSACTPSTATNHRGVAYYDITNPASPAFLGRYEADIETAPPDALPCGPPSATSRCAVGQHSVHLVQRADGKVLSVSTEPLASHPVVNAVNGDLRIVDVTNPRAPALLGAWPPLGSRPSPFSTNGCRRFNNNHHTITDETGTKAHVAYMDDGLFNLDITNPAAVAVTGRFDYPTDRAFEGNAAYVETSEVGGRTLALLSEEDWVAPTTRLRIDAPASLAGTKFACENMATLFDVDDNAQIFRRPGAQVAAPIVYVGRGCPARGNPVGTVPADPYLANGAGKIVAVDALRFDPLQGDISTTSCNFPARLARA